MKEPRYKFPNPTNPDAELIKRRRLQILAASSLYYEFDFPVVTDELYDKWSMELVQLLKDHPRVYSDRFDSYFEEWDGSTGYNLPHRDPWVSATAQMLMESV